MKINPGWRSIEQNIKRPDAPIHAPAQTKSFSDMMQQQEEQASREQLRQKIEEIHRQGERLARSMTVRELRAYKRMIKQFLEDTVKRGVGLKNTRGWDRRGRTKRYQLLDEVDKQLVALGEDLLETEQGRIQLLTSVGEIRGMLINLFF